MDGTRRRNKRPIQYQTFPPLLEMCTGTPFSGYLGQDFGGDLASTWVTKPEEHAEGQSTS